MPVARLLALGLATLDRGTLADMALIEDRARRAAIMRGDLESAVLHQRERDALIEERAKI